MEGEDRQCPCLLSTVMNEYTSVLETFAGPICQNMLRKEKLCLDPGGCGHWSVFISLDFDDDADGLAGYDMGSYAFGLRRDARISTENWRT